MRFAPRRVLAAGNDDGGNDEPPAGAKAPAPGRRATRSAAADPPWKRFAGLSCLFPPEGGHGAVQVNASDLARLQPEEFLNDTAIDFHMRWVQHRLEEAHPGAAQRCYFFNAFFYKKLVERNGRPALGDFVCGWGGGGGGSCEGGGPAEQC
jgi:sentrin-specific protease 7